MQFLHPGFLWALTALAVPIIVHLFNFRRYKTVYFSNVKFIREVQEETTSRSRLKHLLVLASRLLALAFLVMAFAQPYIPNKKNQFGAGKKYVSVYVDNSYSMNEVSGGRSLLEKAKQAAREIVRNYSSDDEFQLLTNDFEGKHQRLVGREEFLTMVDEVDASPSVRTLAEISKRQRDALSRENGKNQTAYLLSDFQKNMGMLSIDSNITYNLIPLSGDEASNIYIDSVWFDEPVQLLNQPAKLIVKIASSGEKGTENNRLTMKLNGETKAMAEFSVPAGSFILDTIGFTLNEPGWNRAELSIQDYPITYDDNYYIAYRVVDKIKVLAIDESKSNMFLDALFKNETEFDYTPVPVAAFDASMLNGKQLVILDNLKTISAPLAAAIGEYVSEGGAVAVFPGANAETDAYNRFLNNLQVNSITGFSEQPQDLAGINVQQNIFKDVFEKVPQNMSLPRVMKYYTFARSSASNEEVILAMKDGSSFFSRYPYKDGSVYVCAVPIDKDFSELPVHAIFIPMLYKMAVLNLHTTNISYFIGDKTRIEVDAKNATGDKVYKIKGQNVEFIPQQFAIGNKILLGLSDQIKKAGFYQVGIENSDTADWLALNFDRRESDLAFYTPAELKAMYNLPNVNVVNGTNVEVASVVKELDRGTALWRWGIILALVFMGVEIALLRFWKA